MEAARKLKVNLKLEGKPCRWCQETLQLADEAAVCTSCNAEHHARCWDGKGGCTTPGCVNEPLKRFDKPAAPAQPNPMLPPAPPPLPYGMMHCPYCRNAIMSYEPVCPYCRAITSPDGIYHGPKVNAPGAVASLVLGIVGLFCFGIIMGPLAIVFGVKARREVAMNPTYTGGGLATAGLVMGIIDTLLFVLIIFMQVGKA